MRLNRHLNEAIILPDERMVKHIKTAFFTIRERWLKMPRIDSGKKLHTFINKELEKHPFSIDVVLKDEDVGNTIQGAAGPGYVSIIHDYDFTFSAWEDKNNFQTWLKSLGRVLKHELVHVEQIKRMKAARNGKDVEDILDGIAAKFADYDKKLGEWVLRDWDNYLASATEIMAHAKSASDTALEGTDNPYLLRKYGPQQLTPEFIIKQAKSSKGIKQLARASRHFNGYYQIKSYMPKTWKKFIRYFVDYIQAAKGNIQEKYVTGVRGWGGYEEIFVNPTKKEIRDAAGDEKLVRWLADSKNKKFYVFPISLVHKHAWDNIAPRDKRDFYEWVESRGLMDLSNKTIIGGSAKLSGNKLVFDYSHTRAKHAYREFPEKWKFIDKYIQM